MTNSPKILNLLKEIQRINEPVAYILQNEYISNQQQLGLKGQDRQIIQNLVAAVNEICGFSIYLARVESTKDTSEDEPASYSGYTLDRNNGLGDDETSKLRDILDGRDAYDFNNDRVGPVSHSIEEPFHVAGIVAPLPKGLDWDHTLSSFGGRFCDQDSYNNVEDYTGNEGIEIKASKLEPVESLLEPYSYWRNEEYRTTCVLIWPMSEVSALKRAVDKKIGIALAMNKSISIWSK